ncbi:mannitol 1-phosphate dehydrogenase [Periconia macrospinosa]|uniref:Mannitol 1-phosphate dehydrogenase n=1 Tax=Periconia macrospinosa TaxID=97972 RepID=A0A2V1E9R0_9PLEO|nr:mannitol 1-phosphate dehydrogenase [Periconia macrospinosa]
MNGPGNTDATRRYVDENYPIAIVGGGLGGLALAVGLIKHGIKTHIYEAAPKFSELGAGVSFGPNAVRALGLIDEKLLQGYKKHATFDQDQIHGEGFAALRWGTDERREGGKRAGDFMAFVEDTQYAHVTKSIGVKTRSCIHRARLLEVLVSMIPEGTTSFNKQFEKVEENPDGTLELHFSDGSTSTARSVVGCDGIRSKVRRFVCGPNIEAKYQNEYALRAVVPKSEAESVLGPELTNNGQFYCGYNGYILTYPIDRGEFINMVALPKIVDEAWPSSTEWTVPATKDDFTRYFGNYYSPIIGLMQKHHLPQKWALFDLEHTKSYAKDRMCLLGDSAHATLPHVGGGAGMAMEDAYVLSSLIAQVQDSGNIERAFQAYDTVRRPRTQKLIQKSRGSGATLSLMMEGVGDDAILLKKRLEESYFHWLWYEDLEKQLEYAKTLV